MVDHLWWVVLVAALALLAVHSLGVKQIVVDNTSLILLVLVLVSPFVAAIKKIKFGEFEAEIEPEEVKRITRRAEQSLPTTITEGTTPPETDAVASGIRHLAESDFVVALAKLRIELESRLRRLLHRVNSNAPQGQVGPLTRVIRELRDEQLIAPEFAASLREVIAICNRAIHGEEIRDVDAEKIVDTGIDLLNAVDQLLREYATVHPTETTVIGTSERDEYEHARYRMTTIVPLVDKPEKHEYILTQDELDSFFENYADFAEFTIGLERLI
jgi:hypothetical protein